ncbi:DUF1525 domain-containing protein [Vibrio ostreicida]|uniref:DUF1525 domain-containing protein n=1 Tax=Vibrio ostreicida TaxID=526588 RepID=UPI003B5908FF
MKKLITVVLMLVTFDVAALTKIEVFFADISPVPEVKEGVDIIYYDLNGLKSLEASLSSRLPNTLEQSTFFLNQYFNSQAGKLWVKNAQLHSKAVAKAVSYQLKGVPAIVFDSSKVVYGTTNIGQALMEYQTHE